MGGLILLVVLGCKFACGGVSGCIGNFLKVGLGEIFLVWLGWSFLILGSYNTALLGGLWHLVKVASVANCFES